MASAPILKKKSPTPNHRDRRTFHHTGVKRSVLNLLAEYFCLRTNDLVELIYGADTESNKASMRRTLNLLRAEKMVYSLPYYNLDIDRGGRTNVNGLTDKGVQFMGDLLPVAAKTFDDHSARTLDHELEISFFHIALKRLCAAKGLRLFWQQRDLKRTINPDAYFAIADPSQPEEKNTFHYLLEVERAKLGHVRDGEPQIVKKLGKYYKFYNSADCERDWGFKQFRVIVVQRTDAKRQFLLAKIAKKYSHRMFWLTTEPLYRENIMGEIFQTPRDYAQRSYSIFTPQS